MIKRSSRGSLFGQTRRASASLMMTTPGVLASSWVVKERPRKWVVGTSGDDVGELPYCLQRHAARGGHCHSPKRDRFGETHSWRMPLLRVEWLSVALRVAKWPSSLRTLASGPPARDHAARSPGFAWRQFRTNYQKVFPRARSQRFRAAPFCGPASGRVGRGLRRESGVRDHQRMMSILRFGSRRVP